MDTSVTTGARRQTLTLTLVIGLHAVFAIALVASTSLRHPAEIRIYLPPPVFKADDMATPIDTPPPVPSMTASKLDVPWVDIGVVPPRTVVTLPLAPSRPVDLPSETSQVPPITAAHVAKGVTLGELCQAYYPAAAKRAGEQGSVVVLIFVAANGRVTDSRVESSSGVPRLDDAAIRCVTREGRFEPQRNGSAAVGSWQRMKYTWRLAS